MAAAKVHFADQARPVTVGREMRRPGQVLREDHPMIVPRGAAMGLHTGEHAHARGRADGRCTDRSVELYGLAGQGIEMLGPDHRITGEPGYARGMLIGQDQENIRLARLVWHDQWLRSRFHTYTKQHVA